MQKKKKFYAVARGRKTGIFSAWFGASGAEVQIKGFAGASYKGFYTIEEARLWMQQAPSGKPAGRGPKKRISRQAEGPGPTGPGNAEAGKIVVYTDGGCSCNPGPGGYGVVLLQGKNRTELTAGFRVTTNNRMELMACIAGLKALKSGSSVILYSDSRYVVNGIAKGWARKWCTNSWMRTKTEAAENYDLWEELLNLCDKHSVEFVWVKGHAGNEGNERCDQLATGSAAGTKLLRDRAYESGKTRVNA